MANSRFFVVYARENFVDRRAQMEDADQEHAITYSLFIQGEFIPPTAAHDWNKATQVRAVSNHNGTDIRRRFAIETFDQRSNNWETTLSKHVLVLLSMIVDHKP